MKASPETLPILSREEQESLIMALISRVVVSSINQVSITLRLHPDVIRDLPNLHAESSLQLESALLDGSQRELSGSSKPSALVQHGRQVNAARCSDVHYLSVPTELEGVNLSVPVMPS